jgi:hypothetical protein
LLQHVGIVNNQQKTVSDDLAFVCCACLTLRVDNTNESPVLINVTFRTIDPPLHQHHAHHLMTVQPMSRVWNASFDVPVPSTM